jgi:hypothetical protein
MNFLNFFSALSTVGSCPRLLGEHVQNFFAKFDPTDCEIITFELDRKVIFPRAQKGQQGLTAFGETFLNYANLMLFTISMHIMLGTCVPNFRRRG